MSSELIILAVVNCYKCKWYEINLNYITTGCELYEHLKKIYISKKLFIDIDLESKRYDLRKITSLYKYCSKNPNRICLYIDY